MRRCYRWWGKSWQRLSQRSDGQRAVLYMLSNNSFWLIGVQLLDGIGAGIFGALTPLVIADVMRGTGRYSLALGAIATMQGIGASLSGLAAGVIVDHFGYSAAFLTWGAAAFVALIVFALGMPETAERDSALESAPGARRVTRVA
jgi:MFS family permease